MDRVSTIHMRGLSHALTPRLVLSLFGRACKSGRHDMSGSLLRIMLFTRTEGIPGSKSDSRSIGSTGIGKTLMMMMIKDRSQTPDDPETRSVPCDISGRMNTPAVTVPRSCAYFTGGHRQSVNCWREFKRNYPYLVDYQRTSSHAPAAC